MKTEIPARLRWACRRGMLELDILLGQYLEEVYATLSPDEQALFVELLGCNDQELFNWLTGKELPKEPQFVTLVEKIREHAQNRDRS